MKNKITETDWENVIDAEIDINSACSNFTKQVIKFVSLCFNFFFGCFRFGPKNICRSLSRLRDSRHYRFNTGY
jgi:hypothetical protein